MMNLQQAKIEAARHFASRGEFSPSHCDVRCAVNDLTADNPGICARGYNQDRAFRDVRRMLATAREVMAV
jgi:hypothetical protein